MFKKYFIAFFIGSFGGWVFSLVHMPIPWTLGPLVSVSVIKLGFKREIYWSTQMRDLAMVVLGYVMGRAFTPETGQHILALLPVLLVSTLITVSLSALGGYFTSWFAGVSLSTSILGSMPGGLSQMSTISETIENADVPTITLMQTIRILAVVFSVPFLSLHGFAQQVDAVATSVDKMGVSEFSTLGIFMGVISILVYLAKYVKIPGRYIISPIVATAVLTLSGMNAPALPQSIVRIAQVCVGIRMGMSVDITSLANWKKITISSVLSIFGVLILLMGLDYFFTRIATITFLTAFIGTAPGGMTEMGLTAMMVHADLSTVVAFQLFRLLFVLLVAIPVASWWFSRPNKRFSHFI